eukprot:13990467-Alexandrium_andersonii.AAC.1
MGGRFCAYNSWTERWEFLYVTRSLTTKFSTCWQRFLDARDSWKKQPGEASKAQAATASVAGPPSATPSPPSASASGTPPAVAGQAALARSSAGAKRAAAQVGAESTPPTKQSRRAGGQEAG